MPAPGGSSRDPLRGIGVAVTRPAHQAEGLCRSIERLGGRAFRFPLLRIVEPRDRGALTAAVAELARLHAAIFTSANAAARALPAIRERGGFPAGPAVIAVGPATAAALGRDARARTPRRYDSEGLLAMPELAAVAGRRIAVFRGEGGRRLLGAELARRGATVIDAIAYRRVRAELDPAPLLQFIERGEIRVVAVTSNEALLHLIELVDAGSGRDHLQRTALIVASERARALAVTLGFRGPILVSGEAGDEAVVRALMSHSAAIE